MAAVHDGKAGHGYVCQALEQTAGRGQRGKTWYTGRNMNLALSAVLEPVHLRPTDIFLVSAAVAVAVRNWLNNYVPGCLIKWPNDIYIHDKKIAGILIENVIRGNKWKYAVAGIGVNINQEGFDPQLAHAVSLAMLTGKQYDIFQLGRELSACLETAWKTLKHNPEQVTDSYNEYLYCKDKTVTFLDGNREFSAVVKYVTPSGELVASGSEGEVMVPRGVKWLK